MKTSGAFVMGMHRSGTSALARVLNLLGLEQAKDLLKPNAHNIAGYWEPKPVVKFNDALLWSHQRHWADPKPISLTQAGSDYDDAVLAAAGLLETQFGEDLDFTVKDPRFSRLLPVWRDAAEARNVQPTCLIAARNPLSVYRSLKKRNGIKLLHAMDLWLTYMLEAERNSRGLPRAFVLYEDVLANWKGALQQVCQTSGLSLPADPDKPQPQVTAFLDKGLTSNWARVDAVMSHGRISRNVKDLYQILLSPDATSQTDEFNRIRGLWHEEWAQKSKGNRASRLARRLPDWHLKHSAELADNGKTDAAIAACREAIKIKPELANAHFRLGNLLFRDGRFADATAPLKRAVELDDTKLNYHMLYARMFARLKQYDDALTAVDAAIGHHPDAALAQHLRGRMLEKLGREKEATVQQAVTEPSPKTARYHFNRARILQAEDDTNEAIVEARKAIALDPDHAQAREFLGLLLAKEKEYAEAEEVLRHLAGNENAPEKLLRNYSKILTKLGKPRDAVKALRRAIDLNPDRGFQYFQLGKLLTLYGDWAGAAVARDAGFRIGAQMLGWPGDTAGKEAGHLKLVGNSNLKLMTSVFAWQSALHWYQRLGTLETSAKPHSGCENIWPLGDQRPNIIRPAIAPCTDQDRPDLSVMLPVYNICQECWLREALESVLAQDKGPDWAEIVIVDDASENDTAKNIAGEFGTRVSYVRNDENLGILHNHNHCVKLARGRFVHILHQDDRILPEFYDRLLAPMQRNPDISYAFSATRIINEKGDPHRVSTQLSERADVLENWLPQIVHGQLISFPSVIVRRSAYEACGGFSPALTFAFDWEMWARLAGHGAVWHDPAELAVYRNHGRSATRTFTAYERLIDCFHTVAGVLPLVSEQQAADIGRHALDRLLANAWGQVRQMDKSQPGFDQLIRFLVTGWVGKEAGQQIEQYFGL